MKDWSAIRERYMRDALPIRLGGLAANLSRIKSFSANDASREAVASLIDESKMFIEWTAAQAETETAAKLVELQVQLALWQLQWQNKRNCYTVNSSCFISVCGSEIGKKKLAGKR